MREAVAEHRPGRPPSGPTGSLQLAARHLVTGVAILTCGDPETVEGVTVSTVALASLKPPLISVALRENSRGLYTLLSRDGFVVNGLSAGQAPLAQHFASRRRTCGMGQLPPETWAGTSGHGVPRLRDAVAWLDCQVVRSTSVGDHRVVFADVLKAAPGGGVPLVNFAGVLSTGPSTTGPHHAERDQ